MQQLTKAYEYVAPQPPHHALLTDLYQLTMAQGYFESGMTNREATFYAFFRENPFEGGYTVAAGVEQVIQLVEGFGLDDDDIAYLASLPAPHGGKLFTAEFLAYLKTLVLTVDIDAVAEGELVFPYEPIMRVSGPIMQCQLLETALLNALNFQTLVATKAARVCEAAGGGVAEFGLRRAQGPDGGCSAARAAYIGGCSSTSNVLAGKLYNIPVSGTHAHAWVMAFDSELEAFRAFANTSPNNCTLLVDTYNVEQGVKNAIIVGQEMRQRGQKLASIRLDSGDLAWLSKKARAMLDEAGFEDTIIVASNDLDEGTITSLKEQGACIDAWGVGTRLSTAYDQAALGGVFKLSAVRNEAGQWEPKIKATATAAKATIPGVLAVRRYLREDGTISGDMIYDTCDLELSELIIHPNDATRRKNLAGRRYRELLQPVVKRGERVQVPEDIEVMRNRCLEGLAQLDPSIKRLLRPHDYPAGIEQGLYHRREEMLIASRGTE